MANQIQYYKHHKTEELFSSSEYANFGSVGHTPPNKKNLPNNGYPYLVIFPAKELPDCMKLTRFQWLELSKKQKKST